MNAANSGVDFALVAFLTFVGFFISLIMYLSAKTGARDIRLKKIAAAVYAVPGLFFNADPKTFLLQGGGIFSAPNAKRDRRPIAAVRSVVPGSPLLPTGNPMIDGIGPASYAERAKVPDLTVHGVPKIVPMSVAIDFKIAKGDPDPRGMIVYGTDGVSAGTVDDIWVDRAESMIRYLQVSLSAGGASVLLPMTMVRINKARKRVRVDAITAAQFVDVPTLENPTQVTFYEEERVTAYYGGGYLYATLARSEPLI